MLAKLASEMQKPDGLTVIGSDEVGRVLEALPIRELCGLGRKRSGSCICWDQDLRRARTLPGGAAQAEVRVVGEKLHFMGRGIDDSPVVPQEEAERGAIGGALYHP